MAFDLMTILSISPARSGEKSPTSPFPRHLAAWDAINYLNILPSCLQKSSPFLLLSHILVPLQFEASILADHCQILAAHSQP